MRFRAMKDPVATSSGRLAIGDCGDHVEVRCKQAGNLRPRFGVIVRYDDAQSAHVTAILRHRGFAAVEASVRPSDSTAAAAISVSPDRDDDQIDIRL